MVYLRNELRTALRYVPLRNELRNGKLRNDVSTQESLRKPQVALRWSRYVAPVLRYDGRYALRWSLRSPSLALRWSLRSPSLALRWVLCKPQGRD